MSHPMKKVTTQKDGVDPSSQGQETALLFPLDSSDGPTASQAQPSAPAAPKADRASADKPTDPMVAAGKPEESDPDDLEAIIEAKRASRSDDDAEESDPFDPSRLRLFQDFSAAAGVQKLLTTVPVRKPSREWFVRTHPDMAYRLETAVLELKEDGEIYLVAPNLWEALATESTFSPRLLVLSVNRQGVAFLWPIRLPGPDGKIDDWSRSALDAANEARERWVRISANMSLGAYDVAVATAQLVEPAWPDRPFKEILRIAFRDRMISTWDHPVLRRLRGEI
jgi:hypothetical protein